MDFMTILRTNSFVSKVACPDTCGGDIATVYDQWVQCNPSSDRPP